MYCYKIKFLVFLVLFPNLSLSSLISDIIQGGGNILQHTIKQFIEEPRDTIFVKEEYDFIVVGAGSGGCVVARRLAENPKWNILLIEAGGKENFYADVPAVAQYLRFTSMDWGYKTIASPDGRYCASLENGQCNYGRGKVLGGTSSINYQFYTRGHRDNYNEWARLGNKGWSYDDVLPYFKKIENFDVPEQVNMSYHGTDGPVHVGYSSKLSGIGQLFLDASKQVGFDYVDYNGKQQVGVSRIQANIKNGVRESASRAYLHPIRHQRNFHVKKLSQVKKILINSKSKKAYGVEYINAGQTYQVRARKEVILSAGAINSPQLLMLSGIGPKDHLEDKNIKVIQDLPVGQTSMDHITVTPLMVLVDRNIGLTNSPAAGLEYAVNFTGPFATTVLIENILFTNVNDINNTNSIPNIEIAMGSTSLHKLFNFYNSLGVPRQLFNELYSEIQHNTSFGLLVSLFQPKSRGKILLKDNRYNTPPIIDPNYFAIDDDLEAAVKGVQLAMEIAKQDAFKQVNATIWDKKMKKCEQYSFYSKDYIRCSIKHFSFPFLHMSGTCRMGPNNDTLAVVDDRLRVKGIKNLRVIDASIMPHIPSAHTNSPTMMIGEKGADLIKEDHK